MSEIQNIIEQLEQQKSAIDNAIAALRGVSGMPTVAARGPGRPKGSTNAAKQTGISEGRQRQIEAMRRYWAQKKAAGKKAPTKAARKGGGMTAEGRRRLSEMMRKRWAAKRAG